MAAAPPLQRLQEQLNDNLLQQGVSTTTTQSTSLVENVRSFELSKLVVEAATPAYTLAAMQAARTRRIENDFSGWLVDQALALRERRSHSLDWDNLAEELEDMAAAQKRELIERLATLYEHFLKMEFQPRKSSEHSRKVTITKTRVAIDSLLKASPGLKGKMEILALDAYGYGCRVAGRDLKMPTREWKQKFPPNSPWTLDQLFDDDFFPSSS
jgi:hypothetical protein